MVSYEVKFQGLFSQEFLNVLRELVPEERDLGLIPCQGQESGKPVILHEEGRQVRLPF